MDLRVFGIRNRFLNSPATTGSMWQSARSTKQ